MSIDEPIYDSMPTPKRTSSALFAGLLALCLAGCSLLDTSDSWQDRDQAADLEGEYTKLVYGYCATSTLRVRIVRIEKNVVDLTLSLGQSAETTYRLTYDFQNYVFAPTTADWVPGNVRHPQWVGQLGIYGPSLVFALPPDRSGGVPRTLRTRDNGTIVDPSGFKVPSNYLGKTWLLRGLNFSSSQLTAFEVTYGSLALTYLDDLFELEISDSPTGQRQIQGSYSLGSFGSGSYPAGEISLSVDMGLDSGPVVSSMSYSCPSQDQMTLSGQAAFFNAVLGTEFIGNVSMGFEPQD